MKRDLIDLDSLKSFGVVVSVIRRKDGYIRKFYKSVRIFLKDRVISNLDMMYLKDLKAYAKLHKFKVSKFPIIERKLTRHGMAERKATGWLWDRGITI